MNELLLVLVFFIVIILVQNYFLKINPNSALYIRLISGIVCLLFIWLTADADKMPIKLLLTVVLLSAIYKAVTNNRKEKLRFRKLI